LKLQGDGVRLLDSIPICTGSLLLMESWRLRHVNGTLVGDGVGVLAVETGVGVVHP
jgi:hypothetical protein